MTNLVEFEHLGETYFIGYHSSIICRVCNRFHEYEPGIEITCKCRNEIKPNESEEDRKLIVMNPIVTKKSGRAMTDQEMNFVVMHFEMCADALKINFNKIKTNKYN